MSVKKSFLKSSMKTYENLFMPYAYNKGADQPAHPSSVISILVVRCLER